MNCAIIKIKNSQCTNAYSNFKLVLDKTPKIFRDDYIEFMTERSERFTRSNLSALSSQANKCWKSLEKYHFLSSINHFLELDRLYALEGKAFGTSHLVFINNFSEFLCKKYYLSLHIPLVKNKFFVNKRFGCKDTYLAFVPNFIKDDFMGYLNYSTKQDYATHSWKVIFILFYKFKYTSIELICNSNNIDNFKKELLKESINTRTYYRTFIKYLRIKYQTLLGEPIIEFKNRIHYIDSRYPKELKDNYANYIKTIIDNNTNVNSLMSELIGSRDNFWKLALEKNVKTIEGVYSLYCSSEWMQAKSKIKSGNCLETLISKYLRYKGYENPELSRRIYQATQDEIFVIKKDGRINYIDTTAIPYYILPLYKKYLKHLKLKSLSGTISRLKHLFYFMKKNKIESLSDLSKEDLVQLKIYFLSKKFSNGTIRQTLGDIQSFYFYVYQTNRQFAAYPEIFHRIQFGRGQDPNTSSIPTSIMKQIAKAIKKEIDPVAKALFAVEYHLGLRLSDILNLKVSCLKPNEIENSYWDFYYYDNKREKYEARHKIPRTLYEPLHNLIDFTINLREESGLEYIFIHNRNDSIQIYSPTGIQYKRQKFIDFHKIVNENGNKFSFDNKLMRRTAIKRMKDSGADFISVSEQFHNTWYTTAKYYDKTNSEEYVNSMVEAVEQITIASSFNDLPSYMTKKDETLWRIEEGYCKSETAVTDKSKMCPHLLKRESCFGCPSMVTTPDFIPALERLYEEWQEEINRLVEFGEDGIKHFEWRLSTISALIERLKVYKKELS